MRLEVNRRSKGEFVVVTPGGNDVRYYMCKCALVCIHLYTLYTCEYSYS